MLISLCLLVMVFNKEDKVVIKSFYEMKGYDARQFVMEFPNKGWKKRSINRLLQKLRNDVHCTIERRPGSDRRRSVRTDENVEVVDELERSQEGKPQNQPTAREISFTVRRCFASPIKNVPVLQETT